MPVSWQMGAFCCALILYACTGSPTPDEFGLAELLTALLLLVSISIPRLKALPVAATCFMVYGLSSPVLIGVISGHSLSLILRDLIAFGFLLMPIFYAQTAQGHEPLLTRMIALVGLAFSIRALLPYRETLWQPDLWLGQPPADLLYLANSPEVLFSALLLLGTGGYMIWSRRSVGWGLWLMALSGLPILAMAVMMQRAGLGCVALAAIFWAGAGFWFRPKQMLVTGALAAILALPFLSFATVMTDSLILKTEMVGLNSRTQEWAAVFDLVSQSPGAFMMGLGWGATFENPAVANLPVNYTHSLISALLLKTGVIGVIFGFAYLWMLAKQGVSKLCLRPVLMVALAAPLGIGVLFYASYKSLGFGLLLLLLALSAYHRKLEKNQ